MSDDFKIVDNSIVPIYENTNKERFINARELHKALENKRKFSDWIKQRIEQYEFSENEEFFKHHNFVKVGNLRRPQIDYYLIVDMAKELCMIENNNKGKILRKYFIEVEKRYRSIVEKPQNTFDVMRLALDQIEENKNKIEIIESKTDVIIKKDYCIASDIAEQLHIHSENDLPHSNLIGAIARELGMKTEYKHYYEDEKIAIVPDITKGNKYYQIYYKPKGVKEIIDWFNKNKEEIEYKIIYERNTKNGKKGEVREVGYKIENVCYKIKANT